ncbi:polynucleotide 5'-hydroxyl-kinase nol9 [Anaeramoeba ignava]|uniref:Polynucleotide 5'-hydroxyl-kinase NOL9 n=1 Tax=Anaeramoeba ignava TaxID=1746090 RepID=A0A9Q0LRL1_ANAIG|nr:polynucleotide 5'-hydroxyl-kinase nol9 [Anaeramoeba ignava]
MDFKIEKNSNEEIKRRKIENENENKNNHSIKTFKMILKPKQKLSFYGKIQIKIIKGNLKILGFNINTSNSGKISIFSPTTLSALTLENNNRNQSTEFKIYSEKNIQIKNKAFKEMFDIHEYLGININTNINKNESKTKWNETRNQVVECFADPRPEIGSKNGVLFLSEMKEFGVLLRGDSRLYNQITSKLVIPDSWRSICKDIKKKSVGIIQKKGVSPVILVCGAQNCGKSTFSKFLLNSMLNIFSCVYHFETDVGQCEFTPPGVISVSRVVEPLFGPGFMRMNWPEITQFYGDDNPAKMPSLYIDMIRHLQEMLTKMQAKDLSSDGTQWPVIINTHGWIHSVGEQLLHSIIKITKPHFIVHLKSENYLLNNDELLGVPNILSYQEFQKVFICESFNKKLNKEDLQEENIGRIRKEKHQASIKFKMFKWDHYFTQRSEVNICLQAPFQVGWGGIRLRVLSNEVPFCEFLNVLNGSLIGLVCDKQEYDCEDEKFNKELPQILQETPIRSAECVGFGVVRSIDMSKKLFYIITPILIEKLKQVNTLVLGFVRLPIEVLVDWGLDFDTPYFSAYNGSKILEGNHEMKRRVGKILVKSKEI